ncbi:MAG: Gluconolactonase [Novosphingobium lindaniclasticum]|jgi:sugar lactone lactonase YvrE|uniref:SMP-30/gluconolactonase/LRE family protein n=1 Tax=Novosphingobium lindaniclasticum TaxID=1329895 RepID=UPI002409959C|nr:SMP-30/gluconolactonase/LRE family protein [Novosphingobium lindaniclasticum]MDF2640355.1 Gluconolactonase [Novosphingobium lindaniclasticum]
MANPLHGWRVDRADIRYIGEDLQRPECILAMRDGTLYSADARGGVMAITPDGAQRFIGQKADPRRGGAAFEDRYLNTQGTLPNGLTFDADGNFLIANFGTDALERMDWEGNTTTILAEMDGRPLGKANFVTRDSRGRLYLTVTTRTNPWTDAVRDRIADGCIILVDQDGARIVADGLTGTNELRLDADETFVYVAETIVRRVSRFAILPDGSLGPRETYGPEDLGGTPDGIAFDAFGNLWMTFIMGEKLAALTAEGEVLILLDDAVPQASAAYEAASRGEMPMTPEIMAAAKGSIAPWMASLTFGGEDLRTVYLGSLQGTRIPFFRSPVPGLPLVHW